MINSVSFLKQKYTDVRKNNPRYSLRAFAKRLGLSPGGLSQILSGKKKLSLSRAHAIAEILAFSPAEKEAFLLMVQIEGAKTPALKSELYERLKTSMNTDGIVNLGLEQFQLISEWYGLAILELVSTIGGQWRPEKIAKYFQISTAEVEVTLERLKRLELIEEIPGEGYRRPPERLIVVSQTPSEAIRKYYRGVLQHADRSITEQTPKEKVVGTEVFAFDASQLEEVRGLTDSYLNQLLNLARTGKKRTHIYQAFVDFFRLNQVEPSGEQKVEPSHDKRRSV